MGWDFICLCLADELGGDNRQVSFVCDTPGRTELEVTWYLNSIMLNTVGNKYSLNYAQSTLTVRSIVASDEGNYSCSYTAQQSQTRTSGAGCLTVYGKLVLLSLEVL